MFLSRAFYIVTAIILNVKSYHITTKNFSLLGEFLLPPLQYIKNVRICFPDISLSIYSTCMNAV